MIQKEKCNWKQRRKSVRGVQENISWSRIFVVYSMGFSNNVYLGFNLYFVLICTKGKLERNGKKDDRITPIYFILGALYKIKKKKYSC